MNSPHDCPVCAVLGGPVFASRREHRAYYANAEKQHQLDAWFKAIQEANI